MNKLVAFFDLFRKGSIVTEPGLWKNRSGFTIALAGVLLSGSKVANAFGIDINISTEDATLVAGGIAVLAGLFSTYATSTKVGLLPSKPVDLPTVSGPDSGGAQRLPEPEAPAPRVFDGG